MTPMLHAAAKAKSRNATLSEHVEQVTLFQWARTAARGPHPELALLFAIPNGGARSPATAGRLKAEGVMQGVPDICLPVARGGFHSLWLELKAQGGRLSAAQQDVINRLLAAGHQVVVAFGWEEARQAIEAYLQGQAA